MVVQVRDTLSQLKQDAGSLWRPTNRVADQQNESGDQKFTRQPKYQSTWLFLSFLIMCTCLLGKSECKILEVSVPWSRLSRSGSYYLTKFKFYQHGHIKLQLGIDQSTGKSDHQMHNFTLGLMSLQSYSGTEEYASCQDKLARCVSTFNLTYDSSSTTHFEHVLSDKEAKSDYIYLVVFDCEGVSKQLQSQKAAKMKFLLELRNQGSHFEAGDEALIVTYSICAVLFLGIFSVMAKSFYFESVTNRTGSVNYAYIIVNVSLLLKLLSLALDMIDLYMISNDGFGFQFLNFMSQAANHISQYLLTVLLVFLAKGWTVLFNTLDEFELFLPISILIGIFKLLIIGLGKMEDGSPMFFHRYDSFIGWVLAAFNLGLYVYFIMGAIECLQRAKTHAKLRSFFGSLVVFGTIYFFSFPCLMLISLGFEAESRTYIIEVGRILSQLMALTYMGYTTGHQKGIYKQVFNFGATDLPR